MKRPIVNIEQSIHQKLLNQAKSTNQTFENVLKRYAMERFLYRLSISPHAADFVLKGGLLLACYDVPSSRPTLDIAIKIDIGFSGGLHPAPVLVDYPTLLSMPSPRLRAYRQESVIAEKFEAMVKHDLATTRMKDFYDIWMLSSTFEYASAELSTAIRQTFKHCKREIEANPFVLQEPFAVDTRLAQNWRVFLRKNNLIDAPREFSTVMMRIKQFLQPITEGIAKKAPINARWMPPGPWQLDRSHYT